METKPASICTGQIFNGILPHKHFLSRNIYRGLIEKLYTYKKIKRSVASDRSLESMHYCECECESNRGLEGMHQCESHRGLEGMH